jgi:hypothetical protein
MAFQHPSEEFVFKLCRESFLSLWSYANPRREGSTKELCDILVVCDPHVLIFSVKYSEYKETEDPNVGMNRWLRETVEHSVKGVYGAERNLARATHVTRSDGQEGLPLPPLADRKIHRVSVSLGGRRLVNFSSGDHGKGFVHCFDDQFVVVALGELNTITDFIAYLEAKEDLARGRQLMMMGGEEDLLAVYLHKGRKFPPPTDRIIVEEDLWASFFRNAAYQRRLEAERDSYMWDTLIEYVAEYVLAGQMESGGTLSDNELVLRTMARETRLSRRMLAGALLKFRERAKRGEASARMTSALSRVTYVFYNPPASNERTIRNQVLQLRCFVARNEIRDNKTVVGIGLNVEPAPEGYAVDLVFLHYPEWPDECQREAEKIKQELGYFRTMQASSDQIDEYPEAS